MKTEKRVLSKGFLRSDFSILVYLALLKFLLHFLVNLRGGYGIFRDEFYYLACADHLAFGYVDHPPLSILLLAINRFILGDSLLAIRLLPAVAGAVVVLLTGLIVREMGGKRFAQALGAVSIIIVGHYLGSHNIFSMNAFDHLFWTLAFYILVRIINSGNPKLWLWFGIVAGLGLQNKISVLFLGFGLFVALLLTPHRRHLVSKSLWIAGLVAFVIFLPHIVWQISNGWPTLEFMSNAQKYKIADFTFSGFLLAQILEVNPFLFPLWFGGLLHLLIAKNGRKYRLFGLMYLAIFAALALQKSKPYYLLVVYPILLAAGAVAWEKFVANRRWGWMKSVTLSIMILSGVLIAPFALPVLPVEDYIKYAAAFGQKPSSDEKHQMGKLPQHFADMHGWENMVATVARVYHTLSEEEKAGSTILVNNYGEAGAIDHYRDKYDLPRPICGHNNYWLWGPRGATGEIIVRLGGNRENHEKVYTKVEQVDTVKCKYCMPYENNLPVFICRGLKTPLVKVWPEMKHYI
ncbi:MAG: ArnT family glycosyltransferase [Candidatus Zixiibacteriota bacterium]